MNFTEYMNRRIYSWYSRGVVCAIGEQIGSAYDADIYVDLDNAHVLCDLERTLPNIRANHVRLGEVLEHLTRDADLLRHLHGRTDSILVTVPYYAPATYHVRLHSDWSIRQLLAATGWEVREYTPRKATRLDRVAWILRGVFGQKVNNLLFVLNHFLPVKPNGGYYYCVPGSGVSISAVNREVFCG